MNKRLEYNTLSAELAQIERALDRMPESARASRFGFEKRKKEILHALENLASSADTLANVALFFGGAPVRGSRAIEADFAARALANYQDVITKKLSNLETGSLANRGPVPQKQASKLIITNVVHGSFGFILEEDAVDEPQLINSSLKDTVDAVTEILTSIPEVDDGGYQEIVEDMDPRVFTSMRNFVKLLHDSDAILKIVSSNHERRLDAQAIRRAYERVEATEIEERDIEVKGVLIGVVPFGRRFDFRQAETGEIISGNVGPAFSQDYLSRLERDENIIGRLCTAKLRRKNIRRTGGRSSVRYTLIDIEADNKK